MIRNLKVLGLALMAVFAFSAVAASAASAVTTDGELTSDGPVKLDVTEIAGKVNALTAFGEKVECPGTTYDGFKYNVTPHELITPPVTTVTVLPTYSTNCTATGPHKATVTRNGCDFVLHIGETTGVADQFGGTVDLVCNNANEAIEVHVYLATNNENVVACTLKVKPQAGLAGGTVTTNTVSDDLALEGTVKGITVEREGLCGAKTTNEGEFHLGLTVTGTNSGGTATGITITH